MSEMSNHPEGWFHEHLATNARFSDIERYAEQFAMNH